MTGGLDLWLRPAAIAILMLLVAASGAQGQEAGAQDASVAQNSASVPNTTSSDNAVPVAKRHFAVKLIRDLVGDQKSLWTSPKNLSYTDATWMVPAGGFAAALVETDADYSRHSSHDKNTMSNANTFSTVGLAALAGSAGAMFVLSYKNGNEHWRETGYLSAEAALNTLAITEAMKYGFGRQRPMEGNGYGDFRAGGQSFPSEHASLAFAIAGVISHEYPGPLTKLLAYGAAGLISAARVRARQHFPADVFVGGLVGDLVAQNVYSRHYDPELGGSEWESVSHFMREHWRPSPKSAGTPYVPLDSWVYPAIERLAAMGFANVAFLSLRPWTRLECATLTSEAASTLGDGASSSQAEEIVRSLQTEFASELAMFEDRPENTLRVESVYTRMMNISGPPLNDSYHFGQTLVDDEGRPYQQGFNNVTGFSAYATAGRFTVYVNGEYQHAPSAPGFSQTIRDFFATIDQTPVQQAVPITTTDRFRLLDTYVSANLGGWDLSFGKESLWWGPGDATALIFSDNAVPVCMARVSRTAPFQLPWIFSKLGPMKVELFYGQLAGNQFPPRPLIHGEKLSFKPTPNLELGFSRTSEFGGVGRALTPAAIFNSYFSYRSSGEGYNSNNNPGKRTGGFDFTYRLPFLRNWLSLYADAISSDDTSPISAPRRAAVWTGLYAARVPGLNKLDLCLEVGYTDTSTSRSTGGKFYYWEVFYYHNLYTNNGNLIGSWVGREGTAYAASSTYHFSSKNTLQLSARRALVNSDFVPGGVSTTGGSAKLNWWVRHDLSASVFVQYERWMAPLLAPGVQTNWTSSVQISFWPRAWTH